VTVQAVPEKQPISAHDPYRTNGRAEGCFTISFGPVPPKQAFIRLAKLHFEKFAQLSSACPLEAWRRVERAAPLLSTRFDLTCRRQRPKAYDAFTQFFCFGGRLRREIGKDLGSPSNGRAYFDSLVLSVAVIAFRVIH
jgi:hypothetical protein